MSAGASRAGIALGSNLDDRLAYLREARDRISALGGTKPPIFQSPIYETAPVGCEPGAPDFYNAVIEIGFQESAERLLSALQEIEESLGRRKRTSKSTSLQSKQARNVSRTIDLDLLYFGNEQRQGGELQLPHPRIGQREFVLRPLAEIAPDLRLAGQTASIRELLARIPPSGLLKCVTTHW